MPRQPSGHSLARLKHSQSSMLRLGACREQRRWSAGTYRCWSLPGDARCPWLSLEALLAPHLFAPRPLVPPSFGRPSKRTLRRLRDFRGPRFFFLEPATTKRSRKIAEPLTRAGPAPEEQRPSAEVERGRIEQRQWKAAPDPRSRSFAGGASCDGVVVAAGGGHGEGER